MRALTPTLLAAQRSSSRKPVVEVIASNKLAGVVNMRPVRLYSGAEDDGPHGLAMSGDGSMIRVQVTGPADNRKLYRQRIAAPGPLSDFSIWTYMAVWGIEACAVCALGDEVSLFWVDSFGGINTQVSPDNGARWGATDWPGFAPAATVTQMAAAYKPSGDIGLFFADLNCVYIDERVGGAWGGGVAWDKTTGDITGVAVVYDGDFELLVSGKDLDGNFKIWSLVYGDGGAVPTGTWTDMKEVAASPAGGAYEFSNLFLDKPDVLRCFFTETFSGSVSYARPFWSHTLPGTAFLDGRWKESTPFATESPHGIGIAHGGNYLWYEMPSGVWRASLAEITLDVSGDILAIKEDLAPDSGKMVIELANGRGQYGDPASGSLGALEIGCQISFSPGYHTPVVGDEVSSGQSFILRDCEALSSPGKSSLFLNGSDGWSLLEEWNARYQFRWNKPDAFGSPTTEAAVDEILAQLLARAGLNLEIISQSAGAAGFFPDFTIQVGDGGRAVINRLLSFIPDLLFLEGNTVYLVNPLATDVAVYSFGTDHLLLEGRYRIGLLNPNRVKAGGDVVTSESFAWGDIQKQGEILQVVDDLNLLTDAEALDRGGAIIRKAEIASQGGYIRTPVNAGQQLLDVITITDPKAGLSGVKRRVLGISLAYTAFKGEFEHKLILGAA